MIDVRGLSYTYAGATTPAVADVTFRVERGEIFGFLGPSGAGKSTTQKILIGLLRDYDGEVKVLGRDANRWQPGDYARIGVSFELPNHYLRLTAMENLRLFRALHGGRGDDPRVVLDAVGLAGDADRPVGEYSKGMRNRLNVARALLHRPEVLFLDEPTSGLDPVTSRRIRDLIRQRREEGTTVFLTTHDMHTADELCDRVAFIVDARIRLIDAPSDLKLRHGRRVLRVALADGRSSEFPLEGLAGDAEFQRILRQETIRTMHTQETTLEEIFIRVTGRELA